MRDLKESLTLDPTSHQALSSRARLYSKQEDFTSAIRDLEDAIEFASDDSVKNALREELHCVERRARQHQRRDYYDVLGTQLADGILILVILVLDVSSLRAIGVSRSTSQEGIRKAYVIKCLKYHPDKVSDPICFQRRDNLNKTGIQGRQCRYFPAYCLCV